MSDFPAIPLDPKTEKNVKLFLDGLAGRMGIEGRAVTYQDLFDAGIIQLKDGVSLANLQPGTDPSDVIEVPIGELPQNPTTPHTLATAGSWGAIFLTWEYDAYNNEYGTEIWRSLVNDRETAGLIKVVTGRGTTDNVGEKETYFYWIRNRSQSNTTSGYNQLAGVQGQSNMVQTAEDLFLTNPELDFFGQPFTVVDLTPAPAPDRTWVIVLNGSVVMQGDLSIGQLTTGGVRPNTVFTIGNGVIELGSDSNNDAYALFAGLGGITENDYLRITDGTIKSFVYDDGINDHVAYKELKRMERGITQHGVETVIPAYFKSEPTVYLTFKDIMVYNLEHPDQNQSVLMSEGVVSPHATVNGSWVFTPTAVLVLSAGVQTELEPYDTYTSSETAEYTSLHEFTDCVGAAFNFTVGSAKATSGGDFQNRRIDVYVDGSIDGGAYSQIATGGVDLTGDGVDLPIVIPLVVLTSGLWKFKYRFVAADRTGTTPGGAEQWVYYNGGEGLYPTVTTGNFFDLLTSTADTSNSDIVQCTSPSIDTNEWTLYKIEYLFNYDLKAEQWNVNANSQLNPLDCDSGLSAFGTASASVPGGENENLASVYNSSSCQYPASVCDGFSTPGVNNVNGYKVADKLNRDGGTGGIVTVSDSTTRAMYLAGKYTNINCQAAGSVDTGLQFPYCTIGTGQARVKINSYAVDYYFRKPVVYSTTPTNHFKADSVSADLGAEEISVGAATINWLAVGE